MLKFRIHLNTIKRLKVVLAGNGEAWVTGCGNVYDNEHGAVSKKLFTNPDQEEATYMIHYVKGDKIPETVEEMEKALFDSRTKELKDYADSRQEEKTSKYKWEEEKSDKKEENNDNSENSDTPKKEKKTK